VAWPQTCVLVVLAAATVVRAVSMTGAGLVLAAASVRPTAPTAHWGGRGAKD